MSLSVGILIPTMGWRVKPCWNKMFWLVVDLPLWKIWKSVGMMTFPTIGENKTCFKPPTSVCFIFQGFQNCFAGIKQRNQRISKEHRCAWMVKPWLLLVILLIETYCLCFHSTMCCRVVEVCNGVFYNCKDKQYASCDSTVIFDVGNKTGPL